MVGRGDHKHTPGNGRVRWSEDRRRTHFPRLTSKIVQFVLRPSSFVLRPSSFVPRTQNQCPPMHDTSSITPPDDGIPEGRGTKDELDEGRTGTILHRRHDPADEYPQLLLGLVRGRDDLREADRFQRVGEADVGDEPTRPRIRIQAAWTPTSHLRDSRGQLPTTSAPIARRKRYSARVSRFGPETATKTPWWQTIRSSRAIRRPSARSSRS